jgi:signal transduction histidine kinase
MRAPMLELPGGFSGRVAQPRKPEERRRVEEILAVARLFLGLAAVAATHISSFGPAPEATLRIVVEIYALQAAAVLAIVRLAETTRRFTAATHAADLIWAAALTTMTSGADSPFFVLFAFALLGAAYRWGMRETLATGAAALGIFTAEAFWPHAEAVVEIWQSTPVDAHALLMRGIYLTMAAVVLGYVAEQERLRIAEVSIGTTLLGAAQSEIGFRSAFKRVAGELLCAFDAEVLLLTVREHGGRSVEWHADHGCEPDGARTTLRAARPGNADSSFLDPRGHAWRIVRHRSSIRMATLDEHGEVMSTITRPTPEAFWPAATHRAAVVIALRFGDNWAGHVAIFLRRAPCVAEARVMRNVVCDVAPVMFNQFLFQRLRSRIAAAERTRVARELHDGVIQSLAGLEMQVGALRRAKGEAIARAGIDDDLRRIQRQLMEEARSVREVMHEIRPLDIPRGQVNEAFADLVERFGRESGVHSRFTAETADVVMPAGTARELGRTLQEALRNVRKHAGATRVDVTFGADNGHWKLVVSNDGRPFDFVGHRTLADLEAAHQGPRVIKERVRDIGGDLAIDSSPGRGVTLEVRVPLHGDIHSHA